MSARYFLSLALPKVLFVNEKSVENVVEAAKEENLEVKVVVVGSMPGFVSLTDIIQDRANPSEIDGFRCTKIENPRDVAMICCSSGSTGMPKGTELSYASLYNSVTPIEDVKMENDVSLWIPTIRWHYGLTLTIETVISNSKWVILTDDNASPELICKVMQKHGVNLI